MTRHSTRKFRTFLVIVLLVAFASSTTSQQKSRCNVRVTLLQVNDVYQFDPVDQDSGGGLARVLTLSKAIKKENPNTLFLLAGDTISPSVESITYQGAQMIDAWNAVGLDYATFGNHEFDFGPEVLKERIKESKFGWVAANVIDTKTGKTFNDVPPFIVREFNGVKIGIFGLVLPETKLTSRPGADVEFRNPCEVARQMVTEIHAQGAKVVVALTHLSMREDKEVARCADIDLIIGGHEHTLLESLVGHAPIFKMTSDARELGRIDLNITPSGELDSIDWQTIPVSGTTKADPDFTAVSRKYATLLTQLAKPVGRTSVALDARLTENRTRETNVGNLVADSFRKSMGADVAILNGGSIRADELLEAGPLTVRSVLSILPFKNKLIKLEVTGETLRAALEHGVSRSAEESRPPAFPQVSGLQFSFDATRPAGSRIVDVKVNGVILNNSRKYALATTTYLALNAGDGYSMLQGSTILTSPERAPFDSDALRQTISSVRTIAPKVQGRITRLDKTGTSRECE